jgi:ectoine hydroxylase-related dioxygenase (phytanoyl-CoA dioxygenase family)
MSVLTSVKAVNRRLGNPLRVFKGAREFVEPRMRMRAYERDRFNRERKYADAGFKFGRQDAAMRELERDGYCVIRNAFDTTVLARLKQQVEAHLDRGTHLQKINKDSARKPGDRSPSTVYFTEEEEKRGQDYFRQHTNYVSIANPLINASVVNEIAFSDIPLDIAHQYLGCVPALGGMNLRKSYRNELPEFDTLYFHVDPNSPRFLKFFFYLNDVDLNGGPFCYVRGSQKKRFRGWMSKGRWSLDEMEHVYGKENVMYLTANVGDIIVADTNGFHRGSKITGNDRTMLTLDYVVHEEMDGTQSRSQFQIASDVLNRLSPKQRAVADFLEVRP